MPTFAKLDCVKCEWTVWAEAGGLAAWDGSCPKCGTNAWTFIGWSRDALEPIQQALGDAGIAGAFVLARRGKQEADQ